MQEFVNFVRNIKKYNSDGEDNIFNDKSLLWDFIFESRPDLEQLSDHDIVAVFNNFLNPDSKQTSGVSDWRREVSEDLIKFYEEEIPKEVLQSLPEPDVGNPLKISIHDVKISSAYAWNLMLYKAFTTIYADKAGASKSWGNILEVGSGYGCLALNLIRTGRAKSYTIIDLHENLLNSFFFLSKTIPSDWSIKILSSKLLTKPDEKTVYFLTPGYIKQLDNINYDTALNSDSLGEMPKETASAYVEWIAHHLNPNGGIFLSKNGHLRSKVGVDRLSAYGYDKFKLIDFRPGVYSSTALDDFSHFIALGSSQSPWSIKQKKYLDVIGDLVRCGLSTDLDELLNRYVSDDLNASDVRLLDAMILNFKGDRFGSTGNVAIDYFFGFMYPMTGIGLKKSSIEHAIGYLSIGRSPHAKVYAYTYLYKLNIIGTKLLENQSGMIRYFCNQFVEEFSGFAGYFKYKVRMAQLLKKIRPRKIIGDSHIIKIKNIYMNIREGRGFGHGRG